MPMSCLETDLDTVFASSDFGEADGAIYDGVTATPVKGIFDDEDVETQNGEGITVLVPQTTFTCASSKVPGLADGKTLLVRGVTYIIRFWKDDGTGVVELHLEKPDA